MLTSPVELPVAVSLLAGWTQGDGRDIQWTGLLPVGLERPVAVSMFEVGYRVMALD